MSDLGDGDGAAQLSPPRKEAPPAERFASAEGEHRTPKRLL